MHSTGITPTHAVCNFPFSMPVAEARHHSLMSSPRGGRPQTATAGLLVGDSMENGISPLICTPGRHSGGMSADCRACRTPITQRGPQTKQRGHIRMDRMFIGSCELWVGHFATRAAADSQHTGASSKTAVSLFHAASCLDDGILVPERKWALAQRPILLESHTWE